MNSKLKYRPEMAPETFEREHLDLLRTLLAFARGQVRSWRQVGDFEANGLSQPLLTRFIRCETSLDMGQDQTMVRKLYAIVFEFVRRARPEYRDTIYPTFLRLYPWVVEEAEPPPATVWMRLEQAFHYQYADARLRNIAAGLTGLYHIHRYGVDGHGRRRIYRSLIRVWAIEEKGVPQLRFEARYMFEHLNLAKSRVSITGDVLIFEHYLFFLGFDELAQTPYVLAARWNYLERHEEAMHGVLVRYGPTGNVFSARAYLSAATDSWDTAVEDVDTFTELEFEARFPGLLSVMEPFINNRIDGQRTPILTDYGAEGPAPEVLNTGAA